MMKKLMQVMCLFAVVCTVQVWATPDSSTWRREVLVGCNDSHFYSYLIEQRNPGSYYKYIETLSLAQYAITTGKLVEQTVIRKTHHLDFDAEGNWMAEEQQQTPFDLNKYLVDNQIDYAFPIAMSDTNIVFEQDGFFLPGKKAKALLLSKSQIESLVPWFSQATKIAALYKADNNYFVLLEAGYHYMDMDFLQAVVVISHHTYQKALDSLSQNAPRWQVQVGCFGRTSNAMQQVQRLEKAHFSAQIVFNDKANCHRVILTPLQATREQAKQLSEQLQKALNIKGYVGKTE